MTRLYPIVSLAIPLHNEESVIAELVGRVRAVLDSLPGTGHSVLFVDDGSIDRTLEYLELAAREDPRIQILVLSRNFGHQAALTAALDRVTGDVIVIMDGDLQDPPEVVPEFVDKYLQGYDVVYARRQNRKEPWPLRACYFLFYRMMAGLSDIRLPLDAGDFGLMSRRVVEQLRKMPEHHRYLRGLRSWVGFNQIGIPVERCERRSGKSKYGMMRLLKLASDGIFAFSIVPIRAAALLGVITILACGFFTLYALYAKAFLDESPRGFTALTMLLVFLSGALLFFLGIIGEYVGRVYEEVKARPLYVVERTIHLERRLSHGDDKQVLLDGKLTDGG